MYDGLNIRWRETAPDRALVSLALAELEILHHGSTDAMQCNIVIERIAGPTSDARGFMYRACVDIGGGLGRRERLRHLKADGLSIEPGRALHAAFCKLRAMAPASNESQAA
jgi:hypothetical protein